MLRCFLLITFFYSVYTHCSENDAIKRINSHFLLKDYASALVECKSQLDRYPNSPALKKSLVRAYAENEYSEEAVALWNELPKDKDSLSLLEGIAWGVLKSQENSGLQNVNLAALTSACITQDARAVQVLLSALSSSSAMMRVIAVQLSTHYRDQVLIQALQRLLLEEKVWFVRLEVIKALGVIGTDEVIPTFKKVLQSTRTSLEEKALTIGSLVNLYDTIEQAELGDLVQSNRAALRQFACTVVSHLDLVSQRELIATLLGDSSKDVRISALNTLAVLGLNGLEPQALLKVKSLIADPDPTVAMTAAWVTARVNPGLTLSQLKSKVYSDDPYTRRTAAYVIGRVGNVGAKLAKEVISISADPFVKVNLALGMLGQGNDSKLICELLYAFLMLYPNEVMWEKEGNPLFRVIAPTQAVHIPQIPQYPKLIDHSVRLEMLSDLAILDYSRAEEALKKFLKSPMLGISYAASTTLFEEGGEEARSLLMNLLKDDEMIVRVQAAIVLGLFGSEPEATTVLESSYSNVDREMKMNIIRALGHIGSHASIPFLIDLLKEPYPSMKILSAAALIQCLYN